MSDKKSFVNINESREEDEANNVQCGVSGLFRRWCLSIPCRYVLTALMTLGFLFSFTQRLVINIALVAMVNFTDTVYDNQTSQDYCPSTPNHSNLTTNSTRWSDGDFNWDPDLQATLLGAFYYGYPLSQLLFGYLTERFGGKAIFALNGFVSGTLTLLIPTVARWSPYALVAIRVMQGLSQGCLYPTTLATLSRWGPAGERTMLYSMVVSGGILGNIIALAVTGVLCQSTLFGGWPSAFYLFGTLTILWAICWVGLAYNNPSDHPRITSEELDYIRRETEDLSNIKYSTPPWCAVSRSLPIWGIFAFLFSNNLGFYITATSMPLYMKHVLHFDISQDGLMSALPSIVQFPFIVLAGIIADIIRRKGIFKIITIRRSGAVIGQFIPGIFLLLVGFVGCNKEAAVSMLILSYLCNAFILSSGEVSLFDVAPLYAGSLMGFMNGISNINGFIAPIIVAKITDNSGDQLRWRTVFYVGTAAYILGTLVYCAFVTDKEASWSKGDRTNKVKNVAESDKRNSS